MPTISHHHLAWLLQVSHTSTYCAMRETKFPYCIYIFQQLKLLNSSEKLHFCHWLCNFIYNHHSILNYIFFSNKAWFRLKGYIIAQNYKVRSSTNPRMHWKTSLHPLKIGVWCVMSRWRIVNPIFLDSMIAAETYRRIITDFIALFKCSVVNACFQQDNTHRHTMLETMQPNHFLLIDWFPLHDLRPPHSPDLSSLDFHFWGYLKDKMFWTAPVTIDELKARITEEINKIDGRILKNVFSNRIKFLKRASQILLKTKETNILILVNLKGFHRMVVKKEKTR